MMKTKKSSKGLALVLAAVLALTPMAGFPITALATGEVSAPKVEAPAADAGDTPQVEAPTADADTNTDTAPGTIPSTPAPDAETPQVEAPATDATQPAAPAAIALTAPAAAVESAAASEGGVVLNDRNFPDPVFRNYVAERLNKKPDDSISSAELLAVTDIFVYGRQIKSMKGIEHFTALTYLRCDNNQLTTLDVSANTALTELYCYKNQLTTLDVSTNTALSKLYCNNNQLTTLDVSTNTALSKLGCNNNQLTTFDTSANTALSYLHCGNNQLTTLDLPATDTLDTLYCYNNHLTTLDISANTALTDLMCSNNQLTTLDVSTNTALTQLFCSNNQLTTLDVSANTALVQLGCDNNQLTTLDISVNTALTGLTCYNNQLTTLDVSTNTALEVLYCWDNQLTTLDVSTNTVLVVLYCYNNQLTTLDLKNLTQLSEPILSPQRSDVVIPVVKRYSYEVDTTVFSGLSNVAVAGKTPDADGKVELPAPPERVTYTFEADSPVLSDAQKTVTVEATNFAYSYLAFLNAGANGTLTFDGAPSATDEILLAENNRPTFTVTPASGYQVATLSVDGEDAKGGLATKDATSQTLTLPPVTDVVAIDVTFEKIPPTPIVNFCSVTATAENGAITSDHATLVREGSSVKCTFSPKEGYALESVSVNGELVKATEEGTTTAKTYSYTINGIYKNTTIHVVFKAVEPPVDPTDPVDPPKPPVDPIDPVDPPKPPVDPADPVVPSTPPAVPDNGGNGNNNGGGTTIVERINTVVVPVSPQAAALETPAAPATAAAATEVAPAQVAADNAAPQGQLENPTLGSQTLDTQHSHIPLALLLLAVWLVGGFAVIRQRKHTREAIDGASY